MSEGIPDGWSIESLCNHSQRVTRRNMTGNDNVLTISAQHGIINQKEYFNKYVSSNNLSNYFHLKRGEFAYNKSYSKGYPVGVVRQLRKYKEGVLSPLYICFKTIDDELDGVFAEYCFESAWVEKEIRIIAKEGARAHGLLNVSVGEFFDITLPLPPLPEQQKIASILTSVDSVIEKTESQIKKLSDLKKGMMQELLTKGIGHTEFKDSPVGRIPKEWDVVALGDVGKWKGGGTPSKSNSSYWSGNIPWVSPKDMKSEIITETQDSISEEAIAGSSTSQIASNSLLMVVRSGILKHTLPVAIAGCDLTINQDMKGLDVSSDFSHLYIFHYLQANNHKVLRATLKAGNTVESLDFNVFLSYLIPYPPLKEQINIANSVESIASKIHTKKLILNTIRKLKKSLMQDLLTGKVRVKVN